MRALNRIGAVLLGLVLLVLGLVTVVETVALTAYNRSWPLPVRTWRRHLMATPWSHRTVLLVSIGFLVVGLLILLSQLRRVRPAHLATEWNSDDDTWVLRRRSVEHQAVAAAETIRGVESASATTTGKQDHWRLAVNTKVVGDVVHTNQVEQAVHDQMRSLGVPEDVPVRVTVHRARHRARDESHT